MFIAPRSTAGWADQGGQGAFTMYALTDPPILTSPHFSRPLTVALTPAIPVIVEPPLKPMPSTIIKALPSMSVPSAPLAAAGIKCGGMQVELDNRTSWLCRLGEWVSDNPLLAAGIVAGTYAVANGKGK